MKKLSPTHENCLVSIRRIEGQVRGIAKMIDNNKYCVDIIHQLDSIIGATRTVKKTILKKHLQNCVLNSFQNKEDIAEKVEEIIKILSKCER